MESVKGGFCIEWSLIKQNYIKYNQCLRYYFELENFKYKISSF